jgi:hypothetical protein
MDMWLENAENNYYTGVILIDFAKAFDSVHHGVLLRRMQSYGICNDWFSSYLSMRKQKVFFNGSLSHECDIKAGVPQGSVLGPLLFSIVINDLPSCLPETTDTTLYADDATLSERDHNLTQVERKLNVVAERCSKWTKANRMRINVDKTKVMLLTTKKMQENRLSVRMDGNVLDQVDTTKILGMQLCSNPSNMSKMVAQQVGKATAAFKSVKEASYYVSPSTTTLLCNAFVKPHLAYCSAAWGAHVTAAEENKLNSVAVRCGKLVWGSNHGLTRDEFIATIGWLPHREQVAFETVCLVYKSLCKTSPPYLHNKFEKLPVRTRAGELENLVVGRAKTTSWKRSFSISGAALWNDLPNEIRSARTFGIFKKLSRTYYGNMGVH